MTTKRDTTARCEDVWNVLADGWSYAMWVVGASRIRAVDAAWPAPGSVIHHSVGAWPLVLSDVTRSVAVHENRELQLEARAMPFGRASITVRLHPDDADVVRTCLTENATDRAWRLETDPMLERGGCLITSARSTIDARLETRLARVIAGLLEDERANAG